MDRMKIEIANIEDVPELLNLQYKAFRPVAESLNWLDAPTLTETVEHALGEFLKYTTLKMLDDDGKIIGSVRGRVEDGALYIGRLMVLPECQGRGYGKILFREIQKRLPHNRVWLFTCGEVQRTVSFYEHEGFRTFHTEHFEKGHTWISMEKIVGP